MVRCTISRLFVLNNQQRLEDAVTKFARQVNSGSASKITKQTYLELCEAQGIAPDERAMPIELEDLPDVVSLALTIFNNLRDTFVPGEYPIYNGKDLTGLPVLFSIYEVTDVSDQRVLLRILNIFDATAVQTARKRIENIRKKNRPSGTHISGS